MQNNHRLRENISKITEQGTVDQQIQGIESLKQEDQHSITFVAAGVEPLTCFRHAFNAVILPQKIENAINPSVPPILDFGSDFVKFLIYNAKLLIEVEELKLARVVIYFDGEKVKHAGKASNDEFVVSKWGRGHVWKHRLYEVPKSYGDVVKFFSNTPSVDEIETAFLEFARWYREKWEYEFGEVFLG